MKKSLLLLGVLSVFLAFSSCTKEENLQKASPAMEEIDHSLVTLKEIKKVFGDNVIVENGTLTEDMPIYWLGDDLTGADLSKSKCNNIIPPCQSLNGIINSQYAQIADDCCCIFAVGTICCGQNGLINAVFVLVTPRDPNCGIIAL